MDFAEHVKQSVDIVKVVGEYVRLKKTGAGPRWVGLCPFHTEKTPSFGVHSVHQFYKCFGCGKGGDVFCFIQEIENVSFFEALKLLAERYGIPMPKQREYSDPATKLRAALLEMHALAARHFQANLQSPQGAEAREYLQRRGVTRDLAAEFGLGYADRSGQTLVRVFQQEGFSSELLDSSGLVLKRQEGSGYYDNFRGRLMFPIANESGKVIAFGGRVLSGEDPRKYLNSPETPIYQKRNVMYNLHRAKESARKNDRAVLVEGYMDVIGVYSAGIREVVAGCGTALTNTQVRAVRRHTEHIIVNFDPDAAGANAAERSIQMLLEESMKIRVLDLGGELDPDEYVRREGADAYRQRLDKAPGYFYWLADRARGRFDMHDPQGRMEALRFLLPAIQCVHDRIERVTIAGDVAQYLRVDQGLVLDHFRKAAAERRDVPLSESVPPIPQNERLLLQLLVASQEVRQLFLPRLQSIGATAQLQARKVFETLLAMHNSGAVFRYSELEARLDNQEKTLMASLVFADELGDEAVLVQQAEACLEALEVRDLQSRVRDLRGQIRAAEQSGRLEEALALTRQLSDLKRG
jgi:DNA primase